MRVAIVALALLVAVVQTAWARAACGELGATAAACPCCTERAPGPVLAADCCAVEDAPAPPVQLPAASVLPAPLVVLVAPPVVATIVRAPAVAATAVAAAVEVRLTGPPLWLRTLSLRL